MATDDTKTNQQPNQRQDAAEHVAEAQRILRGLRQELDKHPDLEKAITNLEMALSLLTTNSGGML